MKQLDLRLDRYPAMPGWKGQMTSFQAAQRVGKRAAMLRVQVLAWFAAGNKGTADDCAMALGESILAVRPRCSELVAMSRIVNTGTRAKMVGGRDGIVWSIAP